MIWKLLVVLVAAALCTTCGSEGVPVVDTSQTDTPVVLG